MQSMTARSALCICAGKTASARDAPFAHEFVHSSANGWISASEPELGLARFCAESRNWPRSNRVQRGGGPETRPLTRLTTRR